MNPSTRPGLSALLALALASAGIGCGETASTTPTDVTPTPPEVLQPTAPGEAPAALPPATDTPAPADAPKAEVTPDSASEAPAPAEAKAAPATPDGDSTAGATIDLVPVKFDELLARIAAHKGAKLTIMDAWATWCSPCKENFPHVVEMHRKYGDRGLAVVSLSLDDPTDAKVLGEAKAFLNEQKAEFRNFVLDEDQEAAFEKLDVLAIPAVFLFGPDGKEIRRFTMDDPNNQFTYDEVEKVVAGLLGADGAEKASD